MYKPELWYLRMNIDIDLVPKDERKEKPQDVLQVSFGTVFSDHMLSMRYDGDVCGVRGVDLVSDHQSQPHQTH